MSNRDPLDALALDLVYGLLEGEEAIAARAKLQSNEGRAALARAEEMQKLFASAAKSDFSNVRFSPPVAEPADLKRPGRSWKYWALAASALFAIGLWPASLWLQKQSLLRELQSQEQAYQVAQSALTQFDSNREQQLSPLRESVISASLDLDKKKTEFAQAIQQAQADAAARKLSLVISGPARLTAGATNDFRVQSVDASNQPRMAVLSAKVKDQSGQVLFASSPPGTSTNWNLRLPPDLPLTPKSELFLELEAQTESGTKSEIREKLPLAPPQYIVHLMTDKPMYQPGETIRFRALVLDRLHLKPIGDDFRLQFIIRDPLRAETSVVSARSSVSDASGNPILGPNGQVISGVGVGEWQIPDSASGGEWILAIRDSSNRFPEQTRVFLVNRYQPARLNKELEWSRKSFGPGDEVIANCKVALAEGGAVADRPVAVEVQVDGKAVPVPGSFKTDSEGRVVVRFRLPATMERGLGSLSLKFTDGGSVESLVKPIPIALKKLFIDFYPEGGELVAGVPNRVYFQCRSNLGKAADVAGRVVDAEGVEVARVETLTDAKEPGINQGQGRFELTPQAGKTYRLIVENPVGTEGEYPLPASVNSGVVLSIPDNASADPKSLKVRLSSVGADRGLFVGVYARGRMLDHRRINVAKGQSVDVDLQPEGSIYGVTRVTVFEEIGGAPRMELKPMAERLVYRKPVQALKIKLAVDKPRYSPRDKVTLNLSATNEAGEASGGILAIGVVDQSVVTMADDKTARTLPTTVFLTSEVRTPEELEHADVLLGDHPQAAKALDLLLGTQGWRRFVEARGPIPANQNQAPAERVIVARVAEEEREIARNSVELTEARIQEEFNLKIQKLTDLRRKSEKELKAIESDKKAAEERAAYEQRVRQAAIAMMPSQARLNVLEQRLDVVTRLFLPAAVVVSLLTTVIAAIRSFWKGRQYRWIAVGAFATSGLLALLLVNRVAEHDIAKTAARVDARMERNTPSPAADMAAGPLQGAIPGAAVQPRAEPQMAENPANLQMPMGGAGDPQQVAKQLEENRKLAKNEGGEPDASKPQPKKVAPLPGFAAGPAPAPPAGARVPQKKQELAKEADAGAPGARAVGGDLGLQDRLARGDVVEPVRARIARDDNGIRGNRNNGRAGGQMAAGGMGMPALPGAGEGRGGGMGGRPGPQLEQSTVLPPFVIREFAHRNTSPSGGERSEFVETLYWHPALSLDKSGSSISFDLADSVTRYRVLAVGHTPDGRLGESSIQIEVRKPISVQPKLPVELTSSDTLDVALTVANDSDSPRNVEIRPSMSLLTSGDAQLSRQVKLDANQRGREMFRFKPSIQEGKAELRFSASSDLGSDFVTVNLPVVPDGFPVKGSVSDVIERVVRRDIVLPKTWIPGTLTCSFNMFPSTLTELQKGLEGLLREPHGCFEQTSSSNYPNSLILNYLNETDQGTPEVRRNAREMLDRGYTKLTSFEVPAEKRRQGFEWFGQSPAHEALSAYGLLQFRDMARVTNIDPELIQRTQAYLMSRRDGKGGFSRNNRALDSFGRAPDDITNAYILWAMTEGGSKEDLTNEFEALAKSVDQSKDSYLHALAANAFLNVGRTETAITLLKELAKGLSPEGSLTGAKMSVTGSRGQSLEVETTALAILGWLKLNRPAEFAEPLQRATQWLGRQRNGSGSFGATQSTILALKALIEFAKSNKQAPEAGMLSVYLGDKLLGKQEYAAGSTAPIVVTVPDADRVLQPGKNELRAEVTGKNSYPYTLSWGYQTLQPPSADDCAVRLSATLDRAEYQEGATGRLRVSLENVSKEGQGMAVAVIGLPAGFKLPDDFKQLREMKQLRDNGTKPGLIGSFEVRGRELVLYWRDLAPDAKIDLEVDVIANVPGSYRGPASRAYLYYTPEAKHWIAPLAATIKPQAN